jgi:beta-galactosidase
LMHRLTNYNFFCGTSFCTTMWRHWRRSVQIFVRCSALKPFVLLCAFVSLWANSFSQKNIRMDIPINKNWLTIASNNKLVLPRNVSDVIRVYKNWTLVDIPHNWDEYEGYRRLLHGNRHGDAWYSRIIDLKYKQKAKRYFLFFEGVSSYATVYLNNIEVGKHVGGRTTFTIDVTDVIVAGKQNMLGVYVEHPANIKDLPWVCGGCSDERGFSEGSQPMGIFRPVHLIVTNDVRIEPFGIHAWATLQNNTASLSVNTTLKNYSQKNRQVNIVNQLVDATGKIVKEISTQQLLKAKDSITVLQNAIEIANPNLWSTDNPYLYNIVSIIKENNIVIDKTETDFGFRTIKWNNASHQFTLNSKPVFINGIAEYEHLLGQSHAFSNEQIIARMKWIQSAGFNAFRDGHQPHNLLYGKLCNEKGILWWTQLSAHVWYDTKEFRDNFKMLLREWVIERRNDPSVILWGLQNESKLPKDFAEECTALIRSLDPTASTQRLVTTCNGGEGTDWDVPQNWTGTYGGNPTTYAQDLKKQILVGEYGAWRAIDLHTEGGFVQNGILSEDRMMQLMEQKIRLAESVKDSVAGQFFWLLTSHDNPGRVQGGEGARELDRIGPVNYKGLLTPWEEPTDAYYMYRSNYADKHKEPMVYIVSHTWPNRWMKPGIKDSIYVYSNCDEVELFNDIDNASLGKQKRNGIGTHFQWDKVNIQYNVLYAVGYVNGKAVARDTITLFHLPQSPNFSKLGRNAKKITISQEGYKYVYRVNCGGPDYKDEEGNDWLDDRAYEPGITGHGSTSWTGDFPGMPSFFASQRRTFAPIKNTKDWKLFQSFRFGKDKLKFEFDLEDGQYLVELYFIEPWLGIGGGINAKGMRLFDVAINDKTVLNDLDIWNEAGTNTVLKKIVKANVRGGKMIISFPETKVGEALISAIAVLKKVNAEESRRATRTKVKRVNSWLDIGDKLFGKENIRINALPSNLFGADWVQLNSRAEKKLFNFKSYEMTDLFLAIRYGYTDTAFLKGFENTNTEIITDEDEGKRYKVYRRRFANKDTMAFHVNFNMIVCLQPVSNMQPAFDLKPITSYRTNVAISGEGVNKEQFAGRECAVIKSNDKVTIEWPVQTGVADIYSVTMKYFYAKDQSVRGKLQLIGPGNSMMLDEAVSFTFTRDGKWNQFTVNTPGMINAGNYTVRLVIEKAEGLAISGIEIQ